MRLYVSGEWTGTSKTMEIRRPYGGALVDEVACAGADEVERALTSAVRGARAMARLTAHERSRIMASLAALMRSKSEDLAKTISLEEGKTLSESKWEVLQSIETIADCAEEAKRLGGETIPLDAAPHGKNKMGITLRVPCGVVAAICPFNFPLLLVCHKLGPALAAGNALILKPAGATPLTSLKLTELLLEAGLPAEGIQTLTGRGPEIGDRLVSDPRVRLVTFTGSPAIGEHISKLAGIKRLTMELGSNSPVIVMADADLDQAVAGVTATGFTNAGQTCLSTQRVFVQKAIYADFLSALTAKVKAIKSGDPLDETVNMGPMIHVREAERVERVVKAAVTGGARVVTGGERDGAIYRPTIVADVNAGMEISRSELFGPAVGVSPFSTIDEAIAAANDSPYGLSASIFTTRLDAAWKFLREVDSGNLHVNFGPQWRTSFMPFGGLKNSGFGREGTARSVHEMTEEKMAVFHL